MRKLLAIFISVFAVVAIGAEGISEYELKDDIVDVASSNEDFSTLVAALDAAGLVETLRSEGPFTVFAPTDAAFAKLPAGTVEALLKDIPTLTNILLHHVVPGTVRAGEVVNLTSAQTAAGTGLNISVTGGSVMVGGATVVATDVQATNGVIHVIDTVMLPPSEDIVDIAAGNGSFSTLVAALQAAGLVDTLRSSGPFTVFAPTDEAFAKLPEGTVEALLSDIPTLTNILLYHVVPGFVAADQAVTLSSAPTASGDSFSITAGPGGVFVDQAGVVATDIFASNGVIHVIDSVIIPN